MFDYATARSNMVESQLRTNKVWNVSLLDAFEKVPRELFVPEDMRSTAYVDEDIGVAENRYLMEPMVLARLLQAAAPQPQDIVLDIGCGSGYATAILASLAATVVALECDAALAAQANRAIEELEINNALIVQAPLDAGYAKQAPYDVIVLNGAVSEVPAAISDQLADGGRLVTVIKNEAGMGRAILMQCSAGVVSQRVIFDASVPLLPGFEAKPKFVF